MPGARSPDIDKRCEERKSAEKMYLESGGEKKLVDIARSLELSDSKIRKWKSIDKWEEKLHSAPSKSKKNQGERSTKKRGSAPPKKRGAPKGNQNAKGGKGNPSPSPPPDRTKHGAYSAVYWDVLDDVEKEMIEGMPRDEEDLLIEQIQLFSVRERRIMQAINKYRDVKSGMYPASVTRYDNKRAFKTNEDKEDYERRQAEKVRNEEILPGDAYSLTTSTGSTIDLITRLEKELSAVQAKKTKAIDSLVNLRLEKQRIEDGEKGSDAVDDWIASVMGEEESDEED